MVNEPVFPAVICTRDGKPYDAVLMSDKAVRKSREHGRIWVLHAATGRLLPYGRDGRLERLDKRPGWWLLTFAPEESAQADQPGQLGESQRLQQPGQVPSREAQPELDRAEPSGELSAEAFSVLPRVAAVVAERKRSLPEGSYTTYLFTQGVDKIRKKTAEEAVELVLAGAPHEIAAEAADLLYHLMVLLEATGVGFAPVLRALQHRE